MRVASGALEPEIVIVDSGLPDIDGYHVARTLRERAFAGWLAAQAPGVNR